MYTTLIHICTHLKIWCKFSIIIKKIDEPSNYAIWDRFSKQHQHQNIKKSHRNGVFQLQNRYIQLISGTS